MTCHASWLGDVPENPEGNHLILLPRGHAWRRDDGGPAFFVVGWPTSRGCSVSEPITDSPPARVRRFDGDPPSPHDPAWIRPHALPRELLERSAIAD